MTRSALLLSTLPLKKVNQTTSEEYSKVSPALVQRINKLMLERIDINSIIGENNTQIMCDNHANHARFINSILSNPNSEVLVDTILWVFRAYRSRGFSSTYWSAQLNTWMEILKTELSADSFAEILPYYEWMLINIPSFSEITDLDLASYNTTY